MLTWRQKKVLYCFLGIGCIAVILFASACRHVHLSTVENDVPLSDLRSSHPFRAEVIDVQFEQISNGALFEKHITNLLGVTLRLPSGKEQTFGGVNQSHEDVEAVKGLNVGTSYLFPNALSNSMRGNQ